MSSWYPPDMQHLGEKGRKKENQPSLDIFTAGSSQEFQAVVFLWRFSSFWPAPPTALADAEGWAKAAPGDHFSCSYRFSYTNPKLLLVVHQNRRSEKAQDSGHAPGHDPKPSGKKKLNFLCCPPDSALISWSDTNSSLQSGISPTVIKLPLTFNQMLTGAFKNLVFIKSLENFIPLRSCPHEKVTCSRLNEIIQIFGRFWEYKD